MIKIKIEVDGREKSISLTEFKKLLKSGNMLDAPIQEARKKCDECQEIQPLSNFESLNRVSKFGMCKSCAQ